MSSLSVRIIAGSLQAWQKTDLCLKVYSVSFHLNTLSQVLSIFRCSFCDFSFFFLVTPHGMTDLSSPPRDQSCIPEVEAQSLNQWIAREVPLRLF